MTKEPLWLPLLNQSLSVFILSKLTPKKTSQEVIQNTKREFIHKSEMFGERFYIITAWICPAAWQWHCTHHSWRQCETRVNATRRKQKDIPKMPVDVQLISVFLLPKDIDFHPRPLLFIKAAELLPQHFPPSCSAPAPWALPDGKPSRTWKQNSSCLLLRNDHGKHCQKQ